MPGQHTSTLLSAEPLELTNRPRKLSVLVVCGECTVFAGDEKPCQELLGRAFRRFDLLLDKREVELCLVYCRVGS